MTVELDGARVDYPYLVGQTGRHQAVRLHLSSIAQIDLANVDRWKSNLATNFLVAAAAVGVLRGRYCRHQRVVPLRVRSHG